MPTCFSPFFRRLPKRPRFYSRVAFKPHSHLFLFLVPPKLAFPDAFQRLSLHLVTLCLVPASSYSRFFQPSFLSLKLSPTDVSSGFFFLLFFSTHHYPLPTPTPPSAATLQLSAWSVTGLENRLRAIADASIFGHADGTEG